VIFLAFLAVIYGGCFYLLLGRASKQW
jgi:hypothetical protein